MNAPFEIDALIRERRSKRGYLDEPVPLDTVREILAVATSAPSSSNSQPWRCIVLTGEALKRVTAGAVDRYLNAPESLAPEYPFFPEQMPPPHDARTTAFRQQLGAAQNSPREDKTARGINIEKQFRFFDAPVGIIFTMDRRLERASFICYGAFLQNIMLAAKARMLDTCAQQIWSLQHRFLREQLQLDENTMVIAGMAMGWADNQQPENRMNVPRAGLDEVVSFRS
jgi:nitroreductase